MTGSGHAANRSFDHLDGALLEIHRHVEAERLRGLEIDHQLVFGRRLHRKVDRLLALQDAINIGMRWWGPATRPNASLALATRLICMAWPLLPLTTCANVRFPQSQLRLSP